MVPLVFAISAKTPIGREPGHEAGDLGEDLGEQREGLDQDVLLFFAPVRASPIMMLKTTTAGTMPLASEKKGLEGM